MEAYKRPRAGVGICQTCYTQNSLTVIKTTTGGRLRRPILHFITTQATTTTTRHHKQQVKKARVDATLDY